MTIQDVDCNCNNCLHFKRDVEQTNTKNNNPQIIACRIHYGYCLKLNKQVAEIANIALLHTQNCFENRRK